MKLYINFTICIATDQTTLIHKQQVIMCMDKTDKRAAALLVSSQRHVMCFKKAQSIHNLLIFFY